MRCRHLVALAAVPILLAGCDTPVAPPTAPALDPPPPLVGALDRGDPVCARRVDIYRETRARVSTGPGHYALYPHETEAMIGPGSFSTSDGVSAGFAANGAQAWVKQATKVACSSWSIGRIQMLVLEGSGTGESLAEVTFPNFVDDQQRPDAHGHSILDVTVELERSAELAFQARLAGQATQHGGVLATATLDAYVRRLSPEPAKDLVKGTLAADGDAGSVPEESVTLAGVLTPGVYRLWVGIRKEGGVAAYTPYPLATGNGAAEGRWAFQFILRELP